MRDSSKYIARFASTVVWMLMPQHGVDGHAFQTKPVSRQFLRTSEFNDGSVHPIEKHADAYNGGGPIVVKARQLERTDAEVLKRYGGGDIWPPAAAWDLNERASNGNYLESDDIAVSHGVCGDTPQSGDDNDIIYSTPNKEWDVLATYDAGSIIDIDVIFTNYHWGHIEFFICCSSDMEDPEGVVTQSCFNKHPLNRAEDDSYNSPVDPNYPGRYYIDPPCRKAETDQTRPKLEGVLNDGHVTHMRYKLPDISCDHAVLQMAYHSGKGCKSPGYDEFNPESWPSTCAPNKEDWIETGSAECRKPGAKYGNVFWQCSDIALRSSQAEPPSETPAPPVPEPPLFTTAPSMPVLATPVPTNALVHNTASPTSTPTTPVVPTLAPVTLGAPTNAPVHHTAPPTSAPNVLVLPTPVPVTPAPTGDSLEDCPSLAPSSPISSPTTRVLPTPEVPPAPFSAVTLPPIPAISPAPIPAVTQAPIRTVTPPPIQVGTPAPISAVTPAPIPTVTPAPIPDVTPVPTYGGNMASPARAPDCLTHVEPYEQCGGAGWSGSSCCLEGYECVTLGACYSQCRPAVCANEWEQCGGSSSCDVWTGPTCCAPGSQCVMKSKGWSHCEPDNHPSCGA